MGFPVFSCLSMISSMSWESMRGWSARTITTASLRPADLTPTLRDELSPVLNAGLTTTRSRPSRRPSFALDLLGPVAHNDDDIVHPGALQNSDRPLNQAPPGADSCELFGPAEPARHSGCQYHCRYAIHLPLPERASSLFDRRGSHHLDPGRPCVVFSLRRPPALNA